MARSTKRKRKTRRVQYEPRLVVVKVLSNDFLRTLVQIVCGSSLPLSSGRIAKEISRILGREYSHAYVSTYLKRLEKWGVVRPYRDPTNGRLLWWCADTKTAEMIANELRKHEIKRLLEVMSGDA